jgi:hypothetical protein
MVGPSTNGAVFVLWQLKTTLADQPSITAHQQIPRWWAVGLLEGPGGGVQVAVEK